MKQKQIKLVVSDLHLGVGRFLENGQLNSLDEFYFDEKSFLNFYITTPQENTPTIMSN